MKKKTLRMISGSSIGMVMVILLGCLVFMQAATAYAAPDEKSFFKGKLIKVIVATSPGGSYDLYARLVSRVIPKYLPGSTVIVKNVPGAGHLIGTKEIYSSKPDGLTFGDFNRGLVVGQIVGQRGMDFDLTKMSWLGSCASVPRALVVSSRTPFKTLDDIVKSEKKVRFSSSGVGTTSHTDIVVIGHMLGAKNWSPVVGYRGAEAETAMMRGELDAQFVTWSSVKPMVERGEFRVLYFTSSDPIPGYETVPILEKIVSEKYKDVASILLMQAKISYPFAGPPNIPEGRLQVLQTAFKESWSDPTMMNYAKKSGLSIHYTGPQQVLRDIKNALKQKPETVKLLKDAYGAR